MDTIIDMEIYTHRVTLAIFIFSQFSHYEAILFRQFSVHKCSAWKIFTVNMKYLGLKCRIRNCLYLQFLLQDIPVLTHITFIF